jgi:(4-(4-[2-(gamma-L-glutamylamino)ethyl]phenoxymethyl)furan-2-yl)methanamine synthase
MRSVIGWDIGGVNTKAALVVEGIVRRVLTRPFELQRAPERLVALLVDMAAALSGDVSPRDTPRHAVTMTAELSQMFRTKRDGVRFVLDAVEHAFPSGSIHVYTTSGTLVSPRDARQRPLDVAAANWVATASMVARDHPDSLLIDIGTTTTDVIPIVGGRVAAAGRTDPGRLTSGELVYSGAVRTPVEAIVREVPLTDGLAAVSAEGFALVGDAHVWLGDLDPADYDATPDGRLSSREFAAERLARVVCADREMLDEAAITRIARAVAEAQAEQIGRAIDCVRSHHHRLDTAVVTGLGAFIADRAARRAGLKVVPLASQLGVPGARSAPATAVALLLHEHFCAPAGLTVIKLGGSLLADPAVWRATIATIVDAAASQRLMVVPGGGPFADKVRWMDARIGLGDDAAHWMAIAAMDQHAEMIAAIPGFVRVIDQAGIHAAHARGDTPVMAPLQWLRLVDPLPHSWDVTSDSIAAWIADAVQAARLVLVKPEGATGDLLDPYFNRALPPNLAYSVTTASELGLALTAPEPSRR